MSDLALGILLAISIAALIIAGGIGTIIHLNHWSKYTAPYTLAAASSKQKWRWAFYSSIYGTVFTQVIILLAHFLPWIGAPAIFIPLPILFWPITILVQRQRLDHKLNVYERLDRKRSRKRTLLFLELFPLDAERRRFLAEGYSRMATSAANHDINPDVSQ